MNSSLIEEFELRAEAAEKKLAELRARVAWLEKGKKMQGKSESKEDEKSEVKTSSHVLGLPSTMNDDYQLIIRKLMDRGPLVQPNSLVFVYVCI